VIPVTVHGPAGAVVTAALLDNGSSASFIDEDLRRALKLEGPAINFGVTTLTEKNRLHRGQQVSVTVSTEHCPSGVNLTNMWSVPGLNMSCGNIPTAAEITRYPHLRDLPVHIMQNLKVQLLIGASSPAITPLEIRPPHGLGEPYAERCTLGWVIRGPSGRRPSFSAKANFISTEMGDESLQRNLDRLWEMDFAELKNPDGPCPSREDERATAVMKSSVRSVNGHYQVALPWKKDSLLPNNKEYAQVRLEQTRRRLLKDKDLHRMYTAQMQEYLDEGYARQSKEPTNQQLWYLPHHPVVNVHKPGRVRIVFDGAARYKGTSINDHLMQGPDLTNSLVGVLLRFRKEKVALIADIKAMYHQVLVPTTDQDALRFLWWPDGNLTRQPREYCMTRHVFGLRSSPSCAAFALKTTAADHQTAYSASVTTCVKEDFYVDDLLTSLPCTDQAIVLAKGLHDLLQEGGFQLEKWASNDRKVLGSIPVSLRAQSVRQLDLTDDFPQEKTLGMVWDPNRDSFRFTIVLKNRPPTKRGILSSVGTLFDPLGMLAPITLEAKRILQALSRLKLGWDDAIPASIFAEWSTWRAQLPSVEQLSIPRLYSPETGAAAADELQLHVFSDASQRAYGACAYLRSSADGHHTCTLVMGKARIAPIKPTTIPRLELTAAMVASRMRTQIEEELKATIGKVVLWTDSTIVLGYIRNTTSRFKAFVTNRLVTIHEHTRPQEWRYVPTRLNPADLASRGFAATDATSADAWIMGPDFLRHAESKWPLDVTCSVQDEDPDFKEMVLFTRDHVTAPDVMMKLSSHFSSLRKARQSLAWWMRLCNVLRKKTRPTDRPLSVHETRQAEIRLVIAAQQRHFSDELTQLKTGHVRPSSKLVTLSPMMDDSLIKTGSRLRFSRNHPPTIILPNKDPLTALIIKDIHTQNGHIGVEQVLAETRSQYWILQGRSAVRREISQCMHCRRLKAPLGEQQMAPLIEEQLQAGNPPFTAVGVDLFGPLRVKVKRSVEKRYGCIFTCLATRAVHLEIAHSLSMESFLAALSRFCARRGTPQKMFSDQGTNFTSADKELRDELRKWNDNQMQIATREKGIEWTFNPAHASHRGGLWERLIRSTRTILRSLANEQLLADETLLTVMVEAERIINSRPITTTSSDSRDPDPLTPADLLLLRGAPGLPLA
jgi:hypothetical protein